MTDPSHLDNDVNERLQAAKRALVDAARPDIVERINTVGKMTARQRIAALLDPDSEVEFGAIAAQGTEGDWIPEAGGVDFVGTIAGQPVIASSTDYTDHGGGYGAGRLGRLFAVAYERRWPVILFADGGGSRAQHPRAGLGHIETSGQIGRFSFLDGLPELSGWAPTVAVVSGPAFAGHASLAGMCDFLVSTPGSSIGMGGPPMVEAALGQRLTPNELAGSEMHETGGGIDMLVDDEDAAIDAVQSYLSFYHTRRADPIAPERVDLDALLHDYEIEDVMRGIIDAGSMFELRPNFARSLITGFARIDGVSIGLIANRASVQDGAIDELAATKIGRFVEQCNTYEYPLVVLVDSPGTVTGGGPGLTRWHTRALLAHQQRTTPLLSVQIGRGGGIVPALMAGVSSTRGVATIKLAWPNVALGERDGFSAVVDHNAFDDVISPNETRTRLARLVRLFEAPAPRTEKKHRIDSW